MVGLPALEDQIEPHKIGVWLPFEGSVCFAGNLRSFARGAGWGGPRAVAVSVTAVCLAGRLRSCACADRP